MILLLMYRLFCALFSRQTCTKKPNASSDFAPNTSYSSEHQTMRTLLNQYYRSKKMNTNTNAFFIKFNYKNTFSNVNTVKCQSNIT